MRIRAICAQILVMLLCFRYGRCRLGRRRIKIQGLFQQIEDSGGKRFVGIRQKQRNLPHLRIIQHMIERWHACQSNAIADFPEGFSRRIVAHADNAGSMRLPKLRCIRGHMLGDR